MKMKIYVLGNVFKVRCGFITFRFCSIDFRLFRSFFRYYLIDFIFLDIFLDVI